MKRAINKKLLYLVPALLCAVILGVATAALLSPRPDADGFVAPRALPSFSVEGLSTDDLKSGTLIFNVFASWCVPCEAEHPLLNRLAEDVPVYGLAFLDKRENTEAFLTRLGDPFTKTGHDERGTAAVSWGIKGVPTTFVLRNGMIVYRHDGPLTPALIESDIRPLLKEWL